MEILKTTAKTGTKIYIFFLKVMIPTLIFVKILAELGGIEYLAEVLTPVMQFLGLSGETGLVVASAAMVNLYAGLSVFSNMDGLQSITLAQATTISFLILVTHNMFIEMAVVRMVGLKLPIIIAFRLLSTVFMAWAFITTANHFGLYQETANILIEPQNIHSSFGDWVLNSLKSMGYLFVAVYVIVFMVELLKALKITNFLEWILSPFVRMIGINKNATSITVIGLLLGLAYGGAFFVEEAKKGTIRNRDIYLSMALLCLTHAIIEDTVLMVVIGGDFMALIMFRLLITFILIALLGLIINRCSDKVFYKYFFHRK
ncbi:MAG: hypothetical protein ACPG8V_02025 [Alphaproteobacteria bacterium]